MDREEFSKLNMAQKTELLWNEGELISSKVYYDYDISLFLLEGFFVEVFFDRLEKAIVGVSLQDNTQILFGYVKDLNLDELVSL